MDDGSVFITKGMRVRCRSLTAQTDPYASVAGMQMKLGVIERVAVGVITHVYGYANTKAEYDRGEFFKRTVVVKPDDGGPEVEWDQKNIVEVLP
jgi:hypothetical protein